MIDRAETVAALRAGGVVAAEDEADDLLAAARSAVELAAMVARRLDGEPTAWITGRAELLGLALHIGPGVYVPRWKTEAPALRALDRLPNRGTAVDLCTGAGAIAAFLAHRRPNARVLATDIDAAAVGCARRNGVDAFLGDLFDPLPTEVRGQVDVVVSVPPYVPEGMLALLPRDVVAHEPGPALDGGPDGLDVVRRIVDSCPEWLRPGGSLVLEMGIDQVESGVVLFADAGLAGIEVVYDGDGDPCGVCGSTVDDSERTTASMRS